MKNLVKKMLMLSSILGVAVLLSGCTTGCGHKKAKANRAPQTTTEAVVFYQTYEEADVTRVHAKMYTHSSNGGESRMGYIKFYETDAGLKMEVDVKDLRPGVTYKIRLYQCNSCASGTCCSKTPLAVNMPTLRIDKPGRLEESFIIRGLTAQQLSNGKIYLERDGGYRAAWGTLETGMML